MRLAFLALLLGVCFLPKPACAVMDLSPDRPGRGHMAWVNSAPMKPDVFLAVRTLAPLASPDSVLGRFYAVSAQSPDALAKSPSLLYALGPLARQLPENFVESATATLQTKKPADRRERMGIFEQLFDKSFLLAKDRVDEDVRRRARQLMFEFSHELIDARTLTVEVNSLRPYLIYGDDVLTVYDAIGTVALKARTQDVAAALDLAEVFGREGAQTPVSANSGNRTPSAAAALLVAKKVSLAPAEKPPAPEKDKSPTRFSGSTLEWLATVKGDVLPQWGEESSPGRPRTTGLLNRDWHGEYVGNRWRIPDRSSPDDERTTSAGAVGRLQIKLMSGPLSPKILRLRLSDGTEFDFLSPERLVPLDKENRLDAAPNARLHRGPASLFYRLSQGSQNQIYLTGRIEASRLEPAAGARARASQGYMLRIVATPLPSGDASANVRPADLELEDALAGLTHTLTKPLALEYVQSHYPQIAARLLVLSAQQRLKNQGQLRFVILNNASHYGGVRRYVNRDARTVVLLGPKYSSGSEVLSAGPVVMVDAKPRGDVRSLREIIVTGKSRPRAVVSGRLVDVDAESDLSAAAVPSRVPIRRFGRTR